MIISSTNGINDKTNNDVTDALKDLQSPFDYDLQSLVLISADPSIGGIDLKPYMVELNYFEDIFSDSISGKVVISDAIGIIKNLAVDGTERLVMKFSDGQASQQIYHQFRVYSISNRSFDIGNMFETYTLNFCSEELLLSQKYRVSKSYSKQSISYIINDILGDSFLQTQKNKNIDDTYGSYDIVLPYRKLFETVNWLTSFAQVNGNTGADMLFYENNNGYNLKSLQTLYSDIGNKYKYNYSYDPKNIKPSNTDSFENQAFTILKLDVMKTFDTLKATSSGTFANRLLTIDPLTRQTHITDFNYADYSKQAKTINPEDVTTINDSGSKSDEAGIYKDRFGSNIFDLSGISQQDGSNQTGKFGVGPLKLMVSNSNQQTQQYISNNSDYVSNDFFVEKTSTYREAQISLLNYNRIKIVVPGNSDLYVGRLLNIDIFGMDAQTMDASSPTREQDTYLSGVYLITAVRHIVNVNRYITVLELSKDSNRTTGSTT